MTLTAVAAPPAELDVISNRCPSVYRKVAARHRTK
jgi:hypothetical protein